MVFKPGNKANPWGRPRHIDPRSHDLQAFCQEHRQDIKKVGEIALQAAIDHKEPWAVKLCMEYFYPKPGTYVAISKEENTEINLTLNSLTQNLTLEDQQTFLKLWLKSKRGIPAFATQVEKDEKVIEAEVGEGLQKA